MGIGHESDQCLVAAQQRVDPCEVGGVVAVVGAGREHRGQIQHGRPDRLEVVQVFANAGQVPAVVLVRGVGATADDLAGFPVGGNRPAG